MSNLQYPLINLNINTNLSFQKNDSVKISYSQDTFIIGLVVNYNKTTGDLLFLPTYQKVVNTGTYNGFTISLSGEIGESGTSGSSGSSGVSSNGTSGSSGSSGTSVGLNMSADFLIKTDGSSGVTQSIIYETYNSVLDSTNIIITDNQVKNDSGEKLQIDGIIRAWTLILTSLPTDSTNLTSGMVWNDSGTLKIV